METRESTGVLNDLILINNDRIEGYQRAKEELKEGNEDLKKLFTDMIEESHKLKLALATEVASTGDEVEDGTTNSGKIYRAWMDVKAAFSGNDRKSVLENCEFGEDAAQKAYEMALKDEELPGHIRALVSDQKATLRVSHDKIKALRDAQV